MPEAGITRRGVLGGGAGLVVSFSLAGRAVAQRPLLPGEVDSFLVIAPTGEVTVYSGKADLGTGLRTTLVQIVADELSVPACKITVVTGDTALTPDQGHLSIQDCGLQIRQAAATARRALLDMAAARLGAPAAALMVDAGRVAAGNAGVTYGELLAGRHFSLALDAAAPTVAPQVHRYVGRPLARADIPAKCLGAFTYVQDVRLEGMLHGRVIRPSTMGGVLKSVDDSAATAVPGYIRLVRDGNFLAVVARTEWAALRAAASLRTDWSVWQGLPLQVRLFEAVRATRVVRDEVGADRGDASAAMARSARQIGATYDFAMQTGGSIAPSCAVAQIMDGHVTVWTAAHDPHGLRRKLAAMLATPVDRVRCIHVDGAACYGQNGHEDAAADAALLSRAMNGQPVRVQWTRADEHGWDPKDPPTLLDLRAGLSVSGAVLAWESELFTPEVQPRSVPLLAAGLADKPHCFDTSPGVPIPAIPYAFPAVQSAAHYLAGTPVRPGWTRTSAHLQNTFASESFIDEIAAAIQADPLAFRMEHLPDPRGRDLLHRLTAVSGWKGRPSPRTDQHTDTAWGRGMAYVRDGPARTHAGLVADVEVTRSTGTIRVTRFHIVQDCGQIINPDGARNQIEGSVIQAMSRVLMEEVTFDRGMVTSLDWGTYPVIRFPDVPDIIIDLIDRPAETPGSAGGPSAAAVPAAIANAVFDATGVRLRSVPMVPAKVMAVLSPD